MTFSITSDTIYLIIICFLMTMQIYQWIVINKMKSEIDSIWKQIHLLTINIASEIIKLKLPKEIGESKEKTS